MNGKGFQYLKQRKETISSLTIGRTDLIEEE
jgi:hypothetical protein